jgi:MscS family membrane protein
VNLVTVVEAAIERLRGKKASALDRQLVPMIGQTLRVVVVVLGVLFVAQGVFGLNVGPWLAGLGIIGLGVSLAAQDSIKNLFGSITILLDQPFAVGERINYAGYDGVVEEIGFRSTKVRTLVGHVVTIPNAKIANESVENIARRPTIRRTINVTITYDTPREKIEEAVEILRRILAEDGIREPIHPVIKGDELFPRVYFNDYNAESLNIFVIYWYAPPEWWPYMEHAQKLNLRIFEEFEAAGIEFAFPTQTLFLAGDAKRRLAVEMLGREQAEGGEQ